jgi:hypothetical protein
MQEPISRSGLQYDIRELPESWYPLLSQTHCLFPLTSTFIPEFIHLDCVFSNFFRNDCGARVLLHRTSGSHNFAARREETPMTRAIPAREIRSNRSNSIFAKVLVSLGVQVRIFDKLPTTFATFVVKVFPDESSHFSSHLGTTSGTN